MEIPAGIFSEIALSLSGGGYRAAAFHLGTLKMLDKLNLLGNVKILSTVSGGTITGGAYACWLADGGVNFEKFSESHKEFLFKTHVISKAFEKLSVSLNANKNVKMPSLARSAAQVYSEHYLIKDKTLNSLINGESKQFKEVIFNSTDFRTGNCFRFQISDNIGIRTGNNRGKVKSEVNKQIRVADIIVASSCFPGGFEPIRFPGDFIWSDDIGIENIRKTLGKDFAEEVPLMDGGVFDNQGIDSVMNVYRRKNNEIDLYIISDTDQRGGNILESKIKNRKGIITLNQIYLLSILIMLLGAITAVALIIDFVFVYKQISFLRAFFLYLIPFIFSSSIALFIGWLRAFSLDKHQLLSDKTEIEVFERIKNLTIHEFIEFIGSRVLSLSAMTRLVFMKRIRDMGFNRIYADENLRKKVIPVLIYDMDNPSKWGPDMRMEEFAPTQQLRDIARLAENYPTNLWVTTKSEFENLIKCGEATTCFQILKYLKQYKTDEINNQTTSISKLYNGALNEWSRLKAA